MMLQIGFSRSNKIFSKIIQIVEKTPFSHAYIKYKDPTTGIIMVAQASKGFVHTMSYDNFKKHNIVIKEYTLNATDISEPLTFIHKTSGIGYSFSQILFIGIKKLFKLELPFKNNGSEYICSEFAAIICKICGIKEIPKDLDYYTPSDLDRLLNKLGVELGQI